MKPKVVISLSGGIDSTTLLAVCRDNKFDVSAVSFIYGSKHNRFELQAAETVADYYGISFKKIDVTEIFKPFKSNLLMDQGEIPEGHYNDSTMSKTVVPCRNMIFASILAGYAESIEASAIALGVHQGDHAIYPDCRPEFIDAMEIAVLRATDGKVALMSPFLFLNKSEIVERGIKLDVPYHLTRTCYKDQLKPCGKCGSCVERLEAFAMNNVTDPIGYAEEGK